MLFGTLFSRARFFQDLHFQLTQLGP